MDNTENQKINTQTQTQENDKNLAKSDSNQKKSHRALFIVITALVFIITEIGRFSSMGWGLFFTPGFAIFFLASCGCFIALKNKQIVDYIMYAIICTLYIIWGYTWIDIVDYGAPSNFLTNLTGIDYGISSSISISVMAICAVLEIFPIIRIITGNRPRKDLDLPWDKYRNLELGIVISIAMVLTVIIAIPSLIHNSINTLVTFGIINTIFAWGGICFANLKQKKKVDYWLFGGLCLILTMIYLSFVLINLSNASETIALPLIMFGMTALPIDVIFLAVKRHFDKYEPRQNSPTIPNIPSKS